LSQQADAAGQLAQADDWQQISMLLEPASNYSTVPAARAAAHLASTLLGGLSGSRDAGGSLAGNDWSAD